MKWKGFYFSDKLFLRPLLSFFSTEPYLCSITQNLGVFTFWLFNSLKLVIVILTWHFREFQIQIQLYNQYIDYINLLSSRAAVADGGLSVRMKYHVYSVLANIGAALPCISDWSSGLPRVTGQSARTVFIVWCCIVQWCIVIYGLCTNHKSCTYMQGQQRTRWN